MEYSLWKSKRGLIVLRDEYDCGTGIYVEQKKTDSLISYASNLSRMIRFSNNWNWSVFHKIEGGSFIIRNKREYVNNYICFRRSHNGDLLIVNKLARVMSVISKNSHKEVYLNMSYLGGTWEEMSEPIDQIVFNT